MRILISTFGDGDREKVLLAMRGLAYDQLVLIGDTDFEDSPDCEKIKGLEEMAGHSVSIEKVGAAGSGFMELVDEISQVLADYAKGVPSSAVVLNISGGSKLLGDAALFAAFRLGVETYHCDEASLVRLPVLKGATARDRFTESQVELIACLSEGPKGMDEAMAITAPASRQSLERTVRELRKAGMVSAELEQGKVVLALTEQGVEVARVLVLSAEDS